MRELDLQKLVARGQLIDAADLEVRERFQDRCGRRWCTVDDAPAPAVPPLACPQAPQTLQISVVADPPDPRHQAK